MVEVIFARLYVDEKQLCRDLVAADRNLVAFLLLTRFQAHIRDQISNRRVLLMRKLDPSRPMRVVGPKKVEAEEVTGFLIAFVFVP